MDYVNRGRYDMGTAVPEREFMVSLTFSDEYTIEKSINEFLDLLGFKSCDDGFLYLKDILTDCILKNLVPTRITVHYENMASKYGVDAKSVSAAITNTIYNAMHQGNLKRLNEIFRCNIIKNGNIKNSTFVSYVCNRFALLRHFNESLIIKTKC